MAIIAPLIVAQPAVGQTACATPPDVVPLDAITAGMSGTGWTTIDGGGTTSFTVDVIGTLHDAIAPGFDLVIFRITDTAFLDEVQGVFAGMSGSPIYDDVSGDLMGAVSYSFWPTDPAIGLFTPAEQMVRILDYVGGPAAMPRVVDAPRWLQRRVPSLADVDAGKLEFTQIATPFTVSGPSAQLAHEEKQLGLPTLRSRLRHEGLDVQFTHGAAATGLATDPTPLDPGTPFGAALSRGDVTWARSGTTTFACGNAAGDLNGAWGHAFFAEGETSFAMTSADVIFVNKDPSNLFGPYVVAEVADLHGTVLQDRLRGLVGEAGTGPASFPVTSDVTNVDTGNQRLDAQTDVFYQKDYWGPEIAFAHVWYNEYATFDAYTGGTQSIDYTIEGTADGVPFTVTNRNMYYSEWSVFYAAYRLYSALYALRYNRADADVQFTSVDATASLTQDELVGRITRVRSSSPLQPSLAQRSAIRARPGQTVHLEVSLKPIDDGASHIVTIDFKVPSGARRSDEIVLHGGSHRLWFNSRGVDTFDELVRKLNGGTHPNDVVASGFGRNVVGMGDLIVKGKRTLDVHVV